MLDGKNTCTAWVEIITTSASTEWAPLSIDTLAQEVGAMPSYVFDSILMASNVYFLWLIQVKIFKYSITQASFKFHTRKLQVLITYCKLEVTISLKKVKCLRNVLECSALHVNELRNWK